MAGLFIKQGLADYRVTLALRNYRAKLRDYAQKMGKITHDIALIMKKSISVILFLAFFIIYAVSPLKATIDLPFSGKAALKNSALIEIFAVGQLFDLLAHDVPIDDFNDNDSAAASEVIVKKKRAVSRSWSLMVLFLLSVLVHLSALFDFLPQAITVWSRCYFSRFRETFKTSEVYLSPHSGLAPPFLLS